MHADRERSRSRRRPSDDTMSTNRPFFSNFLAAFRAQSAIQKVASTPTSTPSPYSHTSAASSQSANHTTSAATRAISAKSGPPSPGATTTAVQATSQFQPTRQHTAPYHRSTSPTAKAFPIPGASRRDRRGSDSSNEGFREVMGSEKWYIGGRTAAGEEKFYKLGMVKRQRSVDRLSLDRLSI
ncbi:hypothetical protein BCR34DRAFT_178814 [Clohesyomyces aquaticus]|uniref:Uncharacterized protein n=1 Tax=Clohesyomyces aquaticus TaxID=1231657 RepID=A0A1Y1ZZ47_9PLEO|nr:hypothetical protein BCR34DRAFT_178814 [Clohesyomyces aquaticus]